MVCDRDTQLALPWGHLQNKEDRGQGQTLHFLASGEFVCPKLWWKCLYLCKGKNKKNQAPGDNSKC